MHILLEVRAIREASRLLQAALRKVEWPAPSRARLLLLTVEVALSTGNVLAAADAIRPLVLQHPYSFQVWELYNHLDIRTGSAGRNLKFLLRLLVRYPHSVPIMVLAGHGAFLSGQLAAAQAEYQQALRHFPNDSILHFMLSLTFLNRITMKGCLGQDRHSFALLCVAHLLFYAQNRGIRSEIWYNLGRACHHLGLWHLATPFYQLVLSDDMVDISCSSLKSEAAFNLALLLREGEARRMAQEVIWNTIMI